MKAMIIITRPPRCGQYFQASDGSQCSSSSSSRITLFCVALLLVTYANTNANKQPLLVATLMQGVTTMRTHPRPV
eukprot:4263836-Ditylum_brightwellii.AAC.1